MIAIASFAVYTLAVAAIAMALTRRQRLDTADGYFLGGRSLSGWVIAGSLVMTNLSTEHLIGLNADAYRHTIAVMAWETTAALAMVLMALYFLPKYLDAGFTTIPEMLERRYGRSTSLIASALFLVSYAVAILPMVLLFGASGLEGLFDVSAAWGTSPETTKTILVWGVGLLGAMYAVFGGLRAVAISDTANGVGFLAASLLIPYLALRYIGSGDAVAGWQELVRDHPDKFDITGDEPGSFLPFGALFTGMVVNQVFFFCTNQSIVQRTLGAKSLAEGQKGVLIAAFLKLLGPLVIVLPGVIAFHLFREEISADDAMLSYPRLVKLVLPTWLTGLFAAVMVGAILSTFNSVLNSAATLFSDGIYRHVLRPDATELQRVRAGRYGSIVLAVAAMIAAPRIDSQGSLYELLQQLNGTFFGPMLAVILVGMLARWGTAAAANVVLLVGPVVYYALVLGWGEQVQAWLRGKFGLSEDIHFLHLLAAVFLLSVLAMRLLSGKAPPAPDATATPQAHSIDMTPWPPAKIVAIVVSAATIGCYVYFAR